MFYQKSFIDFSSFLHYDIVKRVVVFHLMNFPLASFFWQETHTILYIFIFVCIYSLLNIDKLTSWIFFSFLWFYSVFNQVVFVKTIFRWYMLWHVLHLVLSCKVDSYDPLLEKNIYYSSTNTVHWNITKYMWPVILPCVMIIVKKQKTSGTFWCSRLGTNL